MAEKEQVQLAALGYHPTDTREARSSSVDRIEILTSQAREITSVGSGTCKAGAAVLLGPFLYAYAIVTAQRCAQCEKSFRDKDTGPKIKCKRCGLVYCRNCASNLVVLRSYVSLFGPRKNKAGLNMVVCDKCYLEDAFEQERRISIDDEQKVTKGSRKKKKKASKWKNKKKGTRSSDVNDADHGKEEHGEVENEISVAERRRHVRAKTLDRYTAVLLQAAGVEDDTSNKRGLHGNPVELLDDGFKKRMQATAQNVTKLQKASRQRADDLRKSFFSNMVNAKDAVAAGASRASSRSSVSLSNGAKALHLGRAASHIVSRTPNMSGRGRTRHHGGGSVTGVDSIGDADGYEDEDDLDQFEELLEESVQQLHNSKKLLLESEKQLLQSRLETTKMFRTNLLKAQDEQIASAKTDSKEVVKILKNHIAALRTTLRKKLNGEEESNPATSARRISVVPNHLNKTELEQRLFEEEILDMREQLASAIRHLQVLQLEQHYPRSMKWKLRIDAGEGMYVGIRDIEVEKLTADFEVRTGPDRNFLSMRVSNIQAVVGIYQFSIKGSSTMARFLGGILTPTINRLEMNLSGEWVLGMRFEPGGQGHQEPRWVQDKAKSKFSLNISKKTSGASVIRLPDRVIKWLATSVLPALISEGILQNLPTKIGSFIASKHNSVLLQGRLRIIGDMSPKVWRVPLVSATATGEAARRALGISEQEAVILDHLLRGPLATAAGFHKKAISLNRLYKWRLQYASHTTESLDPLLKVVQTGAAVSKVPEEWFPQLVRRMDELAVKPVSFYVDVQEVELDIDSRDCLVMIMGLWLDGVEASMEQATSSKAQASVEKAIREARQTVISTTSYFDRILFPLVRDKLELKLDAMMAGGAGGILACSLRDIVANIRLPSSFDFNAILGAAYVLTDGVTCKFSGNAGPSAGEYTISVAQVDPKTGEQLPGTANDGDLTIRNAVLSLFPAGFAEGTARLAADEIRASILLATLAKLILFDWTEGMPDDKVPEEAAMASELIRRQPTRDREEARKVMERSREIVSRLVGSYYKSAGGASSKRISAKRAPNGNSTSAIVDPSALLETTEEKEDSEAEEQIEVVVMGENMNGEDSESDGGVVLPPNSSNIPVPNSAPLIPFLLDDNYELFADLKKLELKLTRQEGILGTDTVRATLTRSDVYSLETESCATFHIRRNLNDVFDDINPPLE